MQHKRLCTKIVDDTVKLKGRMLNRCVLKVDKKLSCRIETAQRFVSLNILLYHSRSLKVIRNDSVA